MKDFYLKFETEKQSKTVLNKQVIDTYELVEVTDPEVLTSLNELEETEGIVELNDEKYQLFEDEVWNQLTNITYTETPKYRNIDVIGTIYKETGEVEVYSEGIETPVMEAIEGFHVNVRALGDEDNESLESYAIEVATPMRVWA